MKPTVHIQESNLPTLGVLIVNWNSKDFLRQCLLSLEANGDGLVMQIVVVDGASFDGCDEMLKNEFPYVDFLQATTNGGFAKANNLGFKEIETDYLLLLNPDTKVHAGAIRHLLQTAIRCSDAGIVGARLLNTDGSLQTSSVMAFPTPLNQALDSNFLRRKFPRSRLWKTYEAYTSSTTTPVEAVSGACMMMPSDLFRQVDGFSEDYFMYSEDIDLCYKVKQARKKVYYHPTAIITHYGGGSSKAATSYRSEVQKRVSTHHFIHRHYGSVSANLYCLLALISSLTRLPILSTKKIFSSSEQHDFTSRAIQKWKHILLWCLSNKVLL